MVRFERSARCRQQPGSCRPCADRGQRRMRMIQPSARSVVTGTASGRNRPRDPEGCPGPRQHPGDRNDQEIPRFQLGPKHWAAFRVSRCPEPTRAKARFVRPLRPRDRLRSQRRDLRLGSSLSAPIRRTPLPPAPVALWSSIRFPRAQSTAWWLQTLSPDREAEGLGGQVDITPRTAKNVTKPFVEIELGAGYEPLHRRPATGEHRGRGQAGRSLLRRSPHRARMTAARSTTLSPATPSLTRARLRSRGSSGVTEGLQAAAALVLAVSSIMRPAPIASTTRG
jgi:hypothetical protein